MFNKKELSWLLHLAVPQRRKLLFSCISAVMSALLTLVPFVIIYHLSIHWLNGILDSSTVWRLVLNALIAVILRFVFLGLSSLLAHIAAYNLLYDIRTHLTNKLGRLPMGFFNQQQAGKLKKIVIDDVEKVEQLIAHHLPDFIVSIITPICVFVYLLTVDWRMALITLLPIPCAVFIQVKRAHSGAGEDMEKYHQHLERMNGTMIEYIHTMPIIKAFNLTVQSFSSYQNSVEDYTQLWKRLSRKKVPTYVLYTAFIESGLIFILPISLLFFQRGSLTIPEVLLFLMLGVGLTAPMKQLSTFSHTVQNTVLGIKKMNKVLMAKELSEARADVSAIPQHYPIVFDKVSFSYGDRMILQDVTMTMKAGTVTALVGPSGAGKSTIAQLIARFWEVEKGGLFIGGISIRDIPQETLMNLVSYVFQDVSIMNDTLFANICMGNPGASLEEIIQAAKIAQAHDFISALPNGYDTKIGHGGIHLSGGERQRIAIARAIVRNAPVLILDEATAYADSENESHIQAGISHLLQDKTVVIIAHRLSTITDVDNIIVLDAGRVVDQGTHDVLLQHCSLYQQMWHAYMEVDQWTLAGKA